VWRALWTSRLVVFAAGVLGSLAIPPPDDWRGFDPLRLTSPFGYFGNLVVSPFARWDSVWYLQIAQTGYDHEVARTAFFPLYPLLVHVAGFVIQPDLVAGIVISFAAFAIALILLHRLVTLELDAERADLTVLLIAFCPMSYFFSAVYSESLFLALSLGCILRARNGRWATAALLGAPASVRGP
jgi:hypothetical protein